MARHYQDTLREYSPRNLIRSFGLPGDMRIVHGPDSQGQMADWYVGGNFPEPVRIKTIEESVAELEHCL